jgi:hypothetical protein
MEVQQQGGGERRYVVIARAVFWGLLALSTLALEVLIALAAAGRI